MSIETAIQIVGLLLVLLGTFYLSKSVLLGSVAKEYSRMHWTDGSKISLKWVFATFLFGIDRRNWAKFYMSDTQLSKKDIKQIRDYYAPVKGFLFILTGSVLQISSFFL